MTHNPGIAALLSFLLPGLGQIYNGQIITGFVYLALAIPIGVLCFFIVGFIFAIPLWIISVYDAYHTAERKNRDV